MKKALIYILYHPGSLFSFESINNLDQGKSLSVLVQCGHPYISEEITALYAGKFTQFISLPEIDYETNIFRGLIRYFKFIRSFQINIAPILDKVDSFHIISDCSAYLSVNTLLSRLKKENKCGRIISIREDYSYKKKYDLLRTARARIYTALLGLHDIYSHSLLSYKYIREPNDIILRVLNPYEKKEIIKGTVRNIPRFYVRRSILKNRKISKDLVIFYSDKQLDLFSCPLPREEYKRYLKEFFVALSKGYADCHIVCKPHPLDKGQALEEMSYIVHEIYSGTLTSQMHIDTCMDRVRACYSISSTSLLYAASMGIPAYSIYRYLKFNGKYPKEFFENSKTSDMPFLRNLQSLKEIGCIDEIIVEQNLEQPVKDLDKIIEKAENFNE